MFTEVIPPKARKWVYFGATIITLGYAAWQTSNRNAASVVVALAAAAVTELARSNAPAAPTGENPTSDSAE